MADAESLVEELDSRPPTLGASRLLAIDGPAGSGKTTLADAVVRRLADVDVRVELLRLDDLYDGWAGLNPTLGARVIDQLLAPLAHGIPARWQSYNWAARGFDSWHEMAPPDVLVLEGCGAGALDLASYTTLLVWLQTTPDAGQARMVERDGPQVLDHIVAWRRLEEVHFAANRPRERADLRIVT